MLAQVRSPGKVKHFMGSIDFLDLARFAARDRLGVTRPPLWWERSSLAPASRTPSGQSARPVCAFWRQQGSIAWIIGFRDAADQGGEMMTIPPVSDS